MCIFVCGFRASFSTITKGASGADTTTVLSDICKQPLKLGTYSTPILLLEDSSAHCWKTIENRAISLEFGQWIAFFKLRKWFAVDNLFWLPTTWYYGKLFLSPQNWVFRPIIPVLLGGRAKNTCRFLRMLRVVFQELSGTVSRFLIILV